MQALTSDCYLPQKAPSSRTPRNPRRCLQRRWTYHDQLLGNRKKVRGDGVSELGPDGIVSPVMRYAPKKGKDAGLDYGRFSLKETFA